MTPASKSRAFTALVTTLAIQVYVAFAANATAVLVPVIAPEFGLSPKLVGVFIALVYGGSMTAALASGPLIKRHGAIRLSQISVLICAFGLLLLPAASLHPAAVVFLAIAPIVIGVGYGPITPASSQVLARTAPPGRMALTFSIKQTGVPAGTALGGALLPVLALTMGWQAALLAVAFLGVAVAALAEPVRPDLDSDRQRDAMGFSLRRLFAPLKIVFADPMLVETTLIGFFYAALQVSLTTFLVVFMTEVLQRSLVAAGLALTVATLGGVGGRVLWGLVADHYVPPRTLLGILGILGGLCAILTAVYPPDGGSTPLLILCAIFGATAIGWNGVQLAEIARLAPRGEAAAITGATGFISFSSVLIGPPIFGLTASLTGDYGTGFLLIGGATLACGSVVLVRDRRRRRNRP